MDFPSTAPFAWIYKDIVSESERGIGFKIWAVDDVVYGPVEMPMLVDWIKDQRVVADTWIYVESSDTWSKCSKIPEFAQFFRNRAPGPAAASTGSTQLIAGLRPGVLRRMKILGEMNDQQLGRFAQFMEIQQARQFQEIVRQGETGDAMFMVLEGEVRVRQMIGAKETILATMAAGEFFGDISLFDHGPRSADVVANQPSVLLKITTDALNRLTTDAPDLATPFLSAICKTLTHRIRADNKRFRDSITFARASQASRPG
jgi:CRP/FNR family cyclic AMP-dependent transcriptional regulator